MSGLDSDLNRTIGKHSVACPCLVEALRAACYRKDVFMRLGARTYQFMRLGAGRERKPACPVGSRPGPGAGVALRCAAVAPWDPVLLRVAGPAGPHRKQNLIKPYRRAWECRNTGFRFEFSRYFFSPSARVVTGDVVICLPMPVFPALETGRAKPGRCWILMHPPPASAASRAARSAGARHQAWSR
jgi:hypothetical protein